jgi:hypothetical protein
VLSIGDRLDRADLAGRGAATVRPGPLHMPVAVLVAVAAGGLPIRGGGRLALLLPGQLLLDRLPAGHEGVADLTVKTLQVVLQQCSI